MKTLRTFLAAALLAVSFTSAADDLGPPGVKVFCWTGTFFGWPVIICMP